MIKNCKTNGLKKYFVWCYAAMWVMLAYFQIGPVYATDVFTKGKTEISSIYTKLLEITTPIAGLMFTIAILAAVFCTSPQQVQKYKGWALRVLVSWALIVGAGFIFVTVKNVVSGAPDLMSM